MSQYPDNVPTGYAGDYTDFNKVKRDTFGALRSQYTSIAVADSATASTSYGLIPFQKGFRVSYGSKFYTPDLDTASNVTWNLGYLYEDSTETSDPDAFASAVSGQAAAVLSFDENEGMSFEATGNGWVTATLAAGPVTTAGTVEATIDFRYDGTA
ncbi:MAG: hypothetical protein Unbinned5081contig1002_55 [Prokaryotic dsDNA virus sp.]|nr:MAG: hypothetical protein Unbinned5081contig1002_55 [Prokaryotic dsDNA virus sp.]|tara:strand:+ start:17683 stop:18147 length:465 start_codon:yes stop_codon:yes gene_type:complete